MAAVISNQGGFYNTFAYVSEAKRIGVKILPPDVNQSEILWKGRQNFIRVGFLSVKNLSGDTQKRIILNRKEKQFENIADFLERVAPDETEAKSLIHSGAFNSICPDSSHADLLWELSLNRRYTKEKELKMFEVKESVLKPFFPEEDSIIRMRYEYEALGFLCARHPMELHEDALKGQKIVKAKDLPCHVGKHIRAAGLLITGKLVHTKHGEPMEFLTFEDETGLIETVFFPKTYQKFCSILDKSHPFILSGKVEEDFGAVTLAVSHAGPFTFPP
jgi:DNA polymerase-3 subunit alpha/error-prone DNA polymerase